MPFVSPHLNDQFLECYPLGHRIEGREVAVEVEGRYPAANQRHHVPAYNFHIRRLPSNEIVGNVSFRLGFNVHIDNYAGNIGFNVKESHRGHGFAAKALALIGEVIRAHGFERVFITCDPDNYASRRTCENVGARLLGEVTIPEDNDLYARGMRKKLRFEWRLGEVHAGSPDALVVAQGDDMSVAEMVNRKKAVVFDLFHTLTAIESSWGQALPFTYQVLGVPREAWDRQINQCSRARLVGELRDPVRIVSSMARAIDPAISDEVIAVAVANRIKRFGAALIDVPPETIRVLQCLKGRAKRLGLISNADVMEVAEWQKSPIASLFDSTVLSCHVGVAKPDREIYEMCLRELDVLPEETVFVGDGGASELAGARKVGLATVMITGIIKELWPDKIASRKADADYVIERLSELLDRSFGSGSGLRGKDQEHGNGI